MTFSNDICIGILPLGNVQPLPIKMIAANIESLFHFSTKILTSQKPLDFTMDATELRYNAAAVLKALEAVHSGQCDKIIGVLEQDLFLPIFSHVYGEAKMDGPCAVVSLHRLGKNRDASLTPKSIFYERAVKVALHELGHLFNLSHCDEKKCLMHFSGNIDNLDKIPLYLCRYCAASFPNPDRTGPRFESTRD